MIPSSRCLTAFQEATAKLERAQSKVKDLKAQLKRAIANERAAKREANEALLGGLIDPVVEYLIRNKHYDSLEALRSVCTTTNGAVCMTTKKLVYKDVHDYKDDVVCQLGEEIQHICGVFPHLNHVIIEDGAKHISLEGAPANLHILEVRPRGGDECLKSLTVCPSLQDIRLQGCSSVTTIHNLAACTALREINLYECASLHSDVLASLGCCKGLTEVYLDYPQGLASFDSAPFTHMDDSCLLGIAFDTCSALINISHLSSCPALVYLFIRACSGLSTEAFDVLGTCIGLESLELISCDQLHTIPDLSACTKLTEISLTSCNHLSSISSLSSCTALSNLTLYDLAVPDTAFRSLETCAGLTHLELWGCVHLKTFPNLAACTQLSEIKIKDCAELTSLSTLARCPSLSGLSITNCKALPNESFKVLESCTALRSLVVERCPKLKCGPNLRARKDLLSYSFNNCGEDGWSISFGP